MDRLILFLIGIYQRYVSPVKQPSCRFIPSCSEYALEAVKKYGAIKGCWLALYRIIKCNPLCKSSGYDPVP